MPGAARPLGDCSATLPAGTGLSLRSGAIRTWKPWPRRIPVAAAGSRPITDCTGTLLPLTTDGSAGGNDQVLFSRNGCMALRQIAAEYAPKTFCPSLPGTSVSAFEVVVGSNTAVAPA